MELKISCNFDFKNDLEDIVRAFAPQASISDSGEQIVVTYLAKEEGYIIILTNGDDYREEMSISDINRLNPIKLKSELKRLGKVMLYDYISGRLKIKLPYGSLTGIRPTKLFHDFMTDGIDAYRYFIEDLRVDEAVARDIRDIVDNQRTFIQTDNKQIDLFLNIPICATRCAYCSFLAMTYQHAKPYLKDYVAAMIREVDHAMELIRDNDLILRAIYVGGGTPTSLTDEDFASVMRAMSNLNAREFTVEAGRPDSINESKLDSMKGAGVTRISINPQTFNEATLQLIGRSHTNEQLYRAYDMARERDFDVNMDLIAMLPNESLADFEFSLNRAINLAPANITVHTLAMKRGSELKNLGYDNTGDALANEMVKLSKDMIKAHEYRPYYMYKQKYMSGSLENTGYSLRGKECIYNIDIMEESQSILACGAGGISKRLFKSENRLERLANPKGLDVYLDRKDKILIDKQNFFKR